MNWKTWKRSTEATSEDGEIDYIIARGRGGLFFISAYLPGGAEHQLPRQSFTSPEAAMRWVENHEAERAERRARYHHEKPISF